MNHDFIAYPAQGTGTRAGVRMSSAVWQALKAGAEAAGAAPTEGLYSPLDSAAFARAGVKALAAALATQAGLRTRVPANVPMKAPSPLAEPANFTRALEVLSLFGQEMGVVVEKVTALETRANTR